MGSASYANRAHKTDTSRGYGYGSTEHWLPELYFKRKLSGSSGATYAEWENKFQILETGKYSVDLGLITGKELPCLV